MPYHVYTTDGIVLKSTARGEANLALHILTRDLGVIIASVQAARVMQSKLRSGIQDYTLVTISCIKGKNGWKATNAVGHGNFFFDVPEHSRVTLSQVSKTLLAMTPGESPHPEIFEIIKTGFEFLKTISKKDISLFEALIMLRILHELGYVAKEANTEHFLENSTDWSEGVLQKVGEKKQTVVALANKALKESQLQ